ncbi:hypothetical protein Rhal01_00001 [Rubritalea halochordaticola]|uniref:Uncharacterized protein n=1 Tax=Rubritalea halochordaticola TaxID=714537 RepID=A0ABP9UWW0_9BACT
MMNLESRIEKIYLYPLIIYGRKKEHVASSQKYHPFHQARFHPPRIRGIRAIRGKKSFIKQDSINPASEPSVYSVVEKISLKSP